MSVKDVIKNGVYNSIAGGTGLGFGEICLILFVTCLVGVYIFIVYKNFSKAAFYSKDINISIAGMCVVVSAIMIAMQSNLLVSLGMVGALSIVRFRTAVKNPLDLLYLFWSISAGIIGGVGLYVLAIALSAIMTVLIWTLGKIPTAKGPSVIVIRGNKDLTVSVIESVMDQKCDYYHLNSDLIKGPDRELIYEIKVKDKSGLVESISDYQGVKSVNCLEHDGEIRI